MFFVSDNQLVKERKIKKYLNQEPMFAVLLAAVNFEWICGRCIMFLSETPNIQLREKLYKTYGLDKYKDLWKEEVINYNTSIPSLAKIITNWNKFKYAFNLRHKLIHGRETCSRNMASIPVKIMLSAVNDLYLFAKSRNIDLHTRLPIRRNR
jgi:hypothetical protein